MMMYFDFIDKYTLWHIKILDFFAKPTKFDEISVQNHYMGSPMELLCSVYPELKKNEQIVNKTIKELFADGLINTESINSTMTGNGMVASRTTQLGNHFINFIVDNLCISIMVHNQIINYF